MHRTPLTPLLLVALCLTHLPAQAEEVVTTPAVYIAANANHTISFETPLEATLLKSVSLVNVAQQGACRAKEASLAVLLLDDMHTPTVGFNHSNPWVQFIGTNTSGAITVEITALSCACNISVVAVFYSVDPTPVKVSTGPMVIGSVGANMKTDVPLSESYVSGMTLHLLSLVNCGNNPSFQVAIMLSMDVSTIVNTTFTAVGDTLTMHTNTLLHGTTGAPSMNPFVYLEGISSDCVANFVMDLACHHVDIPATMAPPTAVPTSVPPTDIPSPPIFVTPFPPGFFTPVPLGDVGFDWKLFFIIMGSGAGVVLIVFLAIVWKYGIYGTKGRVVTGTVLEDGEHGVEVERGEATSLLTQ